MLRNKLKTNFVWNLFISLLTVDTDQVLGTRRVLVEPTISSCQKRVPSYYSKVPTLQLRAILQRNENNPEQNTIYPVFRRVRAESEYPLKTVVQQHENRFYRGTWIVIPNRIVVERIVCGALM